MPLSNDEMRSAYAVSEQGEQLILEGSSLYHTVLAKDRKTVVVAAGFEPDRR